MTRRTPGSVIHAAVLAAAMAAVLLPAAVFAQAPGQASNPVPADGATNVPVTTTLSWSPGANATRYDVRLGTTSTPPIVQRNVSATVYTPGSALLPGTTYYWQIDARGRGNANTAGVVWTFTTAAAPLPPPSAPASPAPASGATNIPTSVVLTWAGSANATSYDVAFGTGSSPAVVSPNQTATSFDPPGDLAQATTYSWRVTAKGTGGSTLGPLWSFTTAAAPPPSPTLDRLRLMTWNVKAGQDAAGVTNIDAQVELLADSGAHVLVLQELTITAQTNLPALFETKLEGLTGQAWNAVWAPAPLPATGPQGGNLILTTLPVAASSTLSMDSAPLDPGWLDAKRSAAHAAVLVNGVTVHVFGTQLALDAAARQSQMETLQSWIDTFAAPRLVGGDFNMVPGSSTHADMAALFTDSWPALAGGDQGFTRDGGSHASDPPGRVDYWWQEKVDAQARGTEMWVVKTRRSAHHAVLLDVHVQ